MRLWNCRYKARVNIQRIEQNGFRLVEQLDNTSRTVIWKAVQQTLDRTVVIQVLKPEFSAQPSEVAHFLTIARLFAHIKSDSIVAVFDIVSDGDLNYVVMEHVDGPTLEKLITTRGPLPADQALRIAAALIVSLDQMWTSSHIVHRNLKSATIRLDPRGVAKITDFSLAIVAGPGVDATAKDDGNIVGTPCFLSPEQAQGTHTLNTQSDMYALGALLYHLTTGKMPFEDRDVVSILEGHIRHQLPPPHRINHKLSITFSWFVHRLMMKNPNNRYGQWDDVLLDIRLMLAGSTPSCVHAGEEYISTIANFSQDIDKDKSNGKTNGTGAQAVRIKRSKRTAAQQATSAPDERVHEPRKAAHSNAPLGWCLLVCWLALVFWYRAIYPVVGMRDSRPDIRSQHAAAARPVPNAETPASAPSPAPESATPSPEKAPAPAAKPAPIAQAASPATTDVDALPSGIPETVKQGLSKAFADGDLAAARHCLASSPERFREKSDVQALLEKIPDPNALVVAYLNTQIGRPLILEHNGKQRTVIPRGIENNVIQMESNGHGVEIPLAKLTSDEKLRWMTKPQSAAQTVAYCLVLLHSSQRDELHARAASCPLLSDVLIHAAELVPATATAPAESQQ